MVSRLSGSTLAEAQAEADATAGELTFGAAISYVSIYNRDASNDGVFIVNGIAIPSPPVRRPT